MALETVFEVDVTEACSLVIRSSRAGAGSHLATPISTPSSCLLIPFLLAVMGR